ncbi:MAG: hypothetical protein ACTHJT_10790 [Cytophaga sp.]
MNFILLQLSLAQAFACALCHISGTSLSGAVKGICTRFFPTTNVY